MTDLLRNYGDAVNLTSADMRKILQPRSEPARQSLNIGSKRFRPAAVDPQGRSSEPGIGGCNGRQSPTCMPAYRFVDHSAHIFNNTVAQPRHQLTVQFEIWTTLTGNEAAKVLRITTGLFLFRMLKLLDLPLQGEDLFLH